MLCLLACLLACQHCLPSRFHCQALSSHNYTYILYQKNGWFSILLRKNRMRYVYPKFLSETFRPAAWTFRGQKSLILSRFQSLNFEGQGVCTLPLVFAFESVTGSFLQLYHYLVHKVCISYPFSSLLRQASRALKIYRRSSAVR